MTRDADEPSPETQKGQTLSSDTREIAPLESTRRRPPLDAPWLEALLRLAVDLPLEEGPAAVARHALDELGLMLPELALGICIVDVEADEQIIEKRLPEGVAKNARHDPSRLFPQLSVERVLALHPQLAGSSFHVAAVDRAGLDALTSEVIERASEILGQAIVHARALERALDGRAEFRRLQAQVIQAEKLASLGQIVAGIVHELNNPLTSIIAYSDYLKKRLAEHGGDVDDLERVLRIAEAAERILRFSRDLVAYARPAGDVPAPVAIHEVIDKAFVFCEHEFEKSGVSIERRWDTSLPPVRGIPGQLTQVFVNLFTNAAHAMLGRGGHLCVASRPGETREWVEIDVSDDGEGIHPDDAAHIFEPFFTTKTEGRGTGLGLSIVRDIVTAHGGKVVVSSSPGSGARFTLHLPAAARPPTTRPPPG